MPVPALLAIGGSLAGGIISDLLAKEGNKKGAEEIKKLQAQLEANKIDLGKYMAEVDKWAAGAKENLTVELDKSFGMAKEQLGEALTQRRLGVSGYGQGQQRLLEGEKGQQLQKGFFGIESKALETKMGLEQWAAGEGKKDIAMQLGLLQAMPESKSFTGEFLGKLLQGIGTAGGTKIGEAFLKPKKEPE